MHTLPGADLDAFLRNLTMSELFFLLLFCLRQLSCRSFPVPSTSDDEKKEKNADSVFRCIPLGKQLV